VNRPEVARSKNKKFFARLALSCDEFYLDVAGGGELDCKPRIQFANAGRKKLISDQS